RAQCPRAGSIPSPSGGEVGQPLQPLPPLRDVSSILPEAPDRSRGAQRVLHVTGVASAFGPVEGRADVVLLSLECFEPPGLILGLEVRFGFLGEIPEEPAVARDELSADRG